MGIFLNDGDELNAIIVTVYTRELGRVPSGQEMSDWGKAIPVMGVSAFLLSVYGSPEAIARRQRRGW